MTTLSHIMSLLRHSPMGFVLLNGLFFSRFVSILGFMTSSHGSCMLCCIRLRYLESYHLVLSWFWLQFLGSNGVVKLGRETVLPDPPCFQTEVLLAYRIRAERGPKITRFP